MYSSAQPAVPLRFLTASDSMDPDQAASDSSAAAHINATESLSHVPRPRRISARVLHCIFPGNSDRKRPAASAKRLSTSPTGLAGETVAGGAVA